MRCYDRRQGLSKALPDALNFQLKLQNTVTRANMALLENGLNFESDLQEQTMKMILNLFEDQIMELELEASPLSSTYHWFLR